MNPGATLPLRDIHLPPEPSWWPPAPGWWLLALLVAVLLLLLARWLHARWRRRRARRLLLGEYAALERRHPPQADAVGWLAGVSELLRRAARRHAPQALLLQGEDWLRFLDADLPGAPFTRGPGRLLLDGPFRRELDPAALAVLPELVRARLNLLAGAPR